MEHYRIYHREIPAFLEPFLHVPEVERLRKIGMNCGCEYSSFPLFRGLAPYSRFDHSVGAALIVWHFTQSRAQAAAGLLHDISSPVFAHVVDFMNGDYLTQESTEAGTEEIISGSGELQALLAENGLSTRDVCDYHRYSVADNNPPGLSADRLEYTLGNMLNFGICTPGEVRRMYGDLTVGTNGDGQEEIMFRTQETAESFAGAALKCSAIYVSDEDRYAMQILAEILRFAIRHGILTADDLHTTEEEVIARLRRDERTAALWERFRSYTRIIRAESPGTEGEWRMIAAKKRYINPMVRGKGRVSELSRPFSDSLASFLGTRQDYWILGIA